MLVLDDDDYGTLEEEVEQHAVDHTPDPAHQVVEDAADEQDDGADLCAADCAFLPQVVDLVRAHAAGDSALANERMTAIRRATTRAAAKLSRLSHRPDAQTASSDAREVLAAQRDLVAKRKREWLGGASGVR